MIRILLLALLLPTAPQEALEKRIDEILVRLGAEDIDARETAARDLVGLGPDALPILRKRGMSLEGEARGRVEDAIRRIEQERKRAAVLPPLRLVTLEAKDRPAKEVFEEIARQAGVAVDFAGGPPEGALTLSLKDAAPFHAFDAACRRLGDHSFEPQHGRNADDPDDELPPPLAAERAKPARIVVSAGAGPEYPSALARHYRLRVTQITVSRTVDFRQNRSNAHLQMDLQWLPGVRPLALSRFEVEEAVDDQGRSLLKDKPEGRRNFGQRFHRGHFGFRGGGYPQSLQIPVPPADAKKIALLRGTAVFAYPSDTRVLVFENPAGEKGKTLEIKGVKVTLKDIQIGGDGVKVSLDLVGRARAAGGVEGEDGTPFSYDEVQVLSSSGKRLSSHGMSGSGDGTTMSWTLQYPLPAGDTVKEIRIPCVLEKFEDEVKFEIRDIPLPR